VTTQSLLDGPRFEGLVRALMSAFPTAQSLGRLSRYRLGLNLATVASSQGNLHDQSFALVEWAEAQGRVHDLLLGALAENPGNPTLAAFASSLGVSAPAPVPSSEPPVPVVMAPGGDPAAILRELRATLVGLYGDPRDAMRLAADAGISRSRVDFSGPAQPVWFSLLEEAERSGRVGALLHAARQDYPQDATLARLERFVAASPRSAPIAWTPGTALDALQRLLPAQFEEIVFRLAVPTHLMPGTSAPQTERAVALVRLLNQQGRLAALGPLFERVGVKVTQG